MAKNSRRLIPKINIIEFLEHKAQHIHRFDHKTVKTLFVMWWNHTTFMPLDLEGFKTVDFDGISLDFNTVHLHRIKPGDKGEGTMCTHPLI